MSYCGPKGIPLDNFLSWPESSQDAALAWQAYENRRCSGCGTHPDDWDEDEGGSRYAYHAEVFKCPGCVVTQRTHDSEPVQKGGRGVHVRLASGAHGDCERCRPQRG